jgi:hypothetical protein
MRKTLLLLFALSLPAVTTRIYATDEVQYFTFLRSLWFDRDVSFENEYQYFYDAGIRAYGFHETHLELKSETGLRISFATLGSALLWAPFYAVADAGVIVARAAGATIPRDGYSWPYVAAVCYASAVYGFAALLLALSAGARIGLDRSSMTVAAIAIWLGTPLIFYTHVAPVMAHATSAFGVALFVVTWLTVRNTWSFSGSLLLGASAALMCMIREQDIIYLIGPALDFALQHVQKRFDVKATMTPVVGAAVAFVLVYWPQAVAYLALNGRIGPPRLVSRKMNWASPHALQILASPEHGLFFWTPLACLALAGLVVVARMLWRSDASAVSNPRALALCLIVMMVGQVYLIGSLESWTSAGAFGQRRFVGATVLFVIGLAGILGAGRAVWPKRLVAALVAVTIWWNLALIAEFAVGLMDRQRLELRKNAYDAFVTVPRMGPDLAYRYLFNRASFYRSPEE